MAVTDSAASLGFLTAINSEIHGLMGGYLVLNTAGRPLEFHCTTPIKTSRAQQILYGRTLEPFLYGEQIGATLVHKSEQSPLALFVDQAALLAVRDHIDLPTALVVSQPGELNVQVRDGWTEWTIADNRLAVSARRQGDQSLITQRLASLSEVIDLSEPFERIREAIEEAQRTSSRAA